MISDEQLIQIVHELIPCDRVRLSKPLDKTFVIIGHKRNTKDDEGSQYYQDGVPIDFDYFEESTIASGNTPEEVIEDVKKYKRLSELSFANPEDREEIFSLLNYKDDKICSGD